MVSARTGRVDRFLGANGVVPVAAGSLRHEHRSVCCVDELVRGVSVVRIVGDSDARADRRGDSDTLFPEAVRRTQMADEFLGDGLSAIRFRQEDCKFIAADPRDRVAGPGTSPHALGDGDQQLVADDVAVTVVDRFEAIDVDVRDRNGSSAAMSPARRSMKTVRLGNPVNESCVA